MKIPLFAVMLLWSGLSITAEAQVEGKATPELKALQSRYKADVQAALKPIQDRYIAQSEALSRSCTTRGDLPPAACDSPLSRARRCATPSRSYGFPQRQLLQAQGRLPFPRDRPAGQSVRRGEPRGREADHPLRDRRCD